MRICFVCQSGPSEPKAVLLAASLRVHFPPDTELIAAHPSLMGSLRTETEHVLSALGVVTLPIRNPLGDDFLIAHKLAALMLLGGPGLGIFLDTDTLAMAPPEPLLDVLSAVPATDNQFPLPVWQHAYRSFGLSLPASAPPTLRSGERTAPYFNSGMIAVPGPLAGRLAACWIETAQRLEVDPKVPKHRVRDQLSLPIAAMRLGLEIRAIDPRWNFPGWAWRLEGRPLPIIFHYQGVNRLRIEAESSQAARLAAESFPSVRTALAAFSFVI
jgi:hypothetical protein